MNVAIVGSRSFEDYARLTKCVAEVLADRRILMSEVQVISCGADALAAPRNFIYNRRFVKGLKSRMRRKAQLFPGRYPIGDMRGIHSKQVVKKPYAIGEFRRGDDPATS